MLTDQPQNVLEDKSKSKAERGPYLQCVDEDNVIRLKRLNLALFPINYSPLFYNLVIRSGELCKLCFYMGSCVGAVCCRKDDSLNDLKLKEGQYSYYLMTLGVLAPFRRLGLGRMMMDHILKLRENDPTVVKIYLHVQTNNEDAMKFYFRYGFRITETVKDYYKNITPSDAYLLQLDFA